LRRAPKTLSALLSTPTTTQKSFLPQNRSHSSTKSNKTVNNTRSFSSKPVDDFHELND
jgi:hypothetical protein